MIGDARRDAFEKERTEARLASFARSRPGMLVKVVGRLIEVDMSAYHAPASRWEKVLVENVHTWRRPSAAKIDNETTGPTWLKGEIATIIGIIPKVKCSIYGKRPWFMLLASDGTIGWSFELEAFEPVI